MAFFTTSELLEIGGIPFPSTNAKPLRDEALEYYRQVAAFYKLDVRQYHLVDRVSGAAGDFTVNTVDQFGRSGALHARNLAIATGYYDFPNIMGIPGENLSKVRHYYNDAHPYYGLEVAVIGGKNSAAIAALELWRHGARVTLIHRGPETRPHIKYWIKPDLDNRIVNGQIKAYFNSCVTEITPDTVHVETPAGPTTLPNDFVFALTGYHPDFDFMEALGVTFAGGVERLPACDRETQLPHLPLQCPMEIAGSCASMDMSRLQNLSWREIANARIETNLGFWVSHRLTGNNYLVTSE